MFAPVKDSEKKKNRNFGFAETRLRTRNACKNKEMKAKRHKERCVNTSLSRKHTAAEGAHLHRQRAAMFFLL